MQTALAETFRDTEAGREADAILRACVHCGFCTATCPTYRLLGDELDGPRGRIYLMKQVLEGGTPTARTQLHLDRCLTCRSCETTCPSGVRYGRLLDIGRELVETSVPRRLPERLLRRLLRAVIPHRRRFTLLLRAGQSLRRVLPRSLRVQIPPRRAAGAWPERAHARTMLVLQGCVQPALAPDINAAAARVLDRLGIRLIAANDGCCGALSHHLTAPAEARAFMRRNIDAWWPHIVAGAEAIVMTASGCGAHVREYGHLLRDDPAYAERAARVSELTKDISEVVAAAVSAVSLRASPFTPHVERVAFQSPCTLQHGQKLTGVVEALLQRAGFVLTPVADGFLCCGSAGSYSILQRELAETLRARKLETLLAGKPQVIATANIGCLIHLQAASPVPVRHWIELLDESFPDGDKPWLTKTRKT